MPSIDKEKVNEIQNRIEKIKHPVAKRQKHAPGSVLDTGLRAKSVESGEHVEHESVSPRNIQYARNSEDEEYLPPISKIRLSLNSEQKIGQSDNSNVSRQLRTIYKSSSAK